MRSAAVLLSLTLAVHSAQPAPAADAPAKAEAYPDAERLFHQNPDWLGGDAALSIPLSSDRTLWLFGDSFVATTPAHLRREAIMVRNTIAVQTGRDPRTAAMAFAWNTERGTPSAFFPSGATEWYWPGHGIRLAEGPLVVFLFRLAPTPGEGLGFRATGYAVAVIDNPDDAPSTWRPRITDAPAVPFDAIPATAVVRDGEHIVAVAIRDQGTHAAALARYPVAALAKGDVASGEWWAGEPKGWVRADRLGPDGPTLVIEDAGAECSLHWEKRLKRFVHVATYGFGATEIGVRTAPALTGPWTAPRIAYRPPESDGPRPFVYAAKAHPELDGPSPDDLLITYATNSFDFAELVSPEGQRRLYWPRVVRYPIKP